MIVKNLYVLVLWTKVVSALEGLANAINCSYSPCVICDKLAARIRIRIKAYEKCNLDFKGWFPPSLTTD